MKKKTLASRRNKCFFILFIQRSHGRQLHTPSADQYNKLLLFLSDNNVHQSPRGAEKRKRRTTRPDDNSREDVVSEKARTRHRVIVKQTTKKTWDLPSSRIGTQLVAFFERNRNGTPKLNSRFKSRRVRPRNTVCQWIEKKRNGFTARSWFSTE